MYKVALLDAEHWHVLGHLEAMKKYPQVQVTALSGDGEFTEKLSKNLGIKRYPNYRELLQNEKDLDFVYVFGLYKETPTIIDTCISLGLPFIADKPCCEEADQLLPVLEHLREKPVKHAIALQRRFAQPVRKYRDYVLQKASEGCVHLDMRYITAGPFRYDDMGFHWANVKALARGGALLNLAVHYIDLVQFLTGDEIVSAQGVLNTGVWGLGMDDFGAVLLKTKKGHTAVVEVGYTKSGYPQEDFVFSGKDFYITATAAQKMQRFGTVEGGEKRGELIEEEAFQDIQFFDRCLGSMLDCLEGKGEPVAELTDVYQAVRFVSQVYKDNNF